MIGQKLVSISFCFSDQIVIEISKLVGSEVYGKTSILSTLDDMCDPLELFSEVILD
jgi:hypothetical protein